jgi:osmotically-inducible protein OsmY
MRNDLELKIDVQDAVRWDAKLNSEKISVQAQDGLIILAGTVSNYANKTHAESVAKSVIGVKGVLEQIVVHFDNSDEISDHDIAIAVLQALKLNWVPDNNIKLEVENGWVTLEGNVEWGFQKDAAKNAVGSVAGVKVLTNNIIVNAKADIFVEKRAIENALLRYSSTSDENIRVKVSGGTITLNGTVHSFYQKEEAAKIAWNAPGAVMVNNELLIEHDS